MHETFTKRIYVGGLAGDVTSEEIQERLSRFGQVSNLSLKKRVDEFGNKVKVFAHLDLEGDETSIKKCFSTYQNTKWKGSVLQLQFAKESFLQKLEKERQITKSEKETELDASPTLTTQEPTKSQSELFEVKGPAVPGTPVPGKKDWVVGKYGRVLPVLKLKKSYKTKMVKYDPSKHCHAAKVFKDDKVSMQGETSCNKLTWEINTPDTEITKKRKGEFPEMSHSSTKIKKSQHSQFNNNTPSKNGSFHLSSDSFSCKQQLCKIEKDNQDLEIVKVGIENGNSKTSQNKSNKFDSDIDSDSEMACSDMISCRQQNGIKNVASSQRPGNTNLDVKLVSKSVSKNSVMTPSLSANKASENKRSVVLAENKEQKPSVKKSLLVDKSNSGGFDNGKKIPEFKGIGMLGLSAQSNRTANVQSHLVVDSEASRSSNHKIAFNSTHDLDVSGSGNSEKPSQKFHGTLPSGRLDISPDGLSKQAADNERRLQAIRENMKLRQLQQSSSQTALSNVDYQNSSSSNKRVIFSSSDEDDDDCAVDATVKDNKQEKSRLTLFDSHDEDEDDYGTVFKSRPHFEGEKGEKLMRLEHKIGDPRFKLDARFALSDSEDEETKEQSLKTELNKSLDVEKTSNLQVLEKVIGKEKLDRFSEKLKRNTKQIIDMNAVRFDPTKVQKKAEIAVSVEKKPQKKKDSLIPDTDRVHIIMESGKTSKIKQQEAMPKADGKFKKEDLKKNHNKNITETKLKFETTKMKSSDQPSSSINSTNTDNKSKIQLSSSLVDMFKQKNQAGLENEGTESFSLLKQFDEDSDEDDYRSKDEAAHSNERGVKEHLLGPLNKTEAGRSSAPMSALFKETKNEILPGIKSAPAVKTTSEDSGEMTSESEQEDSEFNERSKQASNLMDSEDIDSDDNDSDKESSDEDERSHNTPNDVDEQEAELIYAGKVDVRYSKEEWLKRWEDIRSVLIKMYKRKHRDALKNKRKHNEMKKRKIFLKNSRKKSWLHKKVS